MEITRQNLLDKAAILGYFRSRNEEIVAEGIAKYGGNRPSKIASYTGKKIGTSRKSLIDVVVKTSQREGWNTSDLLDAILRVTYCSYVVMIEARNSFRAYEYMDFSRRIGELWEPFCKICFDYSSEDIELFVPPLFSEVRNGLQEEVTNYIDQLNITDNEKEQLKEYYSKVWSLVVSGEIKLELDLHFVKADVKYVIDFKSGFGSNEKGNTNRLLLVATIYQNLDQNFQPILLVRSDNNNQYYNRLRDSGCWSAHSGEDTYIKIAELTGFDMREWVNTNINWEADMNEATYTHLNESNLTQYLNW